MRVYVDGVFDLFHVGHLKSLQYARKIADSSEPSELIVGVISDDDAAKYKRRPIIPLSDRSKVIQALSVVSRVIESAPLIIDLDFTLKENIDLVVHGFANEDDRKTQAPFFTKLGDKFLEIPYTTCVSTSKILKMITENS